MAEGGGGRWRGDALPERLKSAFVHRRLDVCGLSSSRASWRKAAITSSPCCGLPPVPLMLLIPSIAIDSVRWSTALSLSVPRIL